MRTLIVIAAIVMFVLFAGAPGVGGHRPQHKNHGHVFDVPDAPISQNSPR